MSNFNDEFKHFIASNGIVGITAGICIGAATTDIIGSLVNNLLFPLIVIVLNAVNIKNVSKLMIDNNKLQLFEFFKSLITWILVVVFTFIFIQVAFYQLLGVDKNLEKK